MFQWVKPRGSTLYEGLGAVLPLPVKWPRLTGAIGASLQRRHTTCDAWRHIKPNHMKYTDILYQIYHIYEIYWYTVPNIPYISKLYWTICTKYTDILYQIHHIFQSCTRQSLQNILIYCTKYTIYFKAVLNNLYQIYHIFQTCTRQSVWNIPYILYQIYYILYQINHIFQNYTKYLFDTTKILFQPYTTYNLHFKQTFKKYFHLFWLLL